MPDVKVIVCPVCKRKVPLDSDGESISVHSIADDTVLLMGLLVRMFGGEEAKKIPLLPMDKCPMSGAKVEKPPHLKLVP